MTPALNKSLTAFCAWLEQTPPSQYIQVHNWVVPTMQTVHIVAIAMVASSALMIDLRLLRAFGTEQPAKAVLSRFLPFVWWPLIVLLVTGVIMIVGEPARSLKNPAFQLKMALLIGALIVTVLVQLLVRRYPSFADQGGRRGGTLAITVTSMLLWAGIIFAGRWIAYY